MALQKPALKATIKQLLQDMIAREDASYEEFADRLSTAIDTFVKTGTVTVASGIAVATTGTAAAQTGSTTAQGTGTIS